MNLELLKQLYCIFSPSGQEKKMRKFIKRYSRKLGAYVTQDDKGNVYVTKGNCSTYPCIVAHMDQVQHNHSKDFACVCNDDAIFGFSKKSRAQQGLGADDKNGIFVALECLAKYDVLKCAFFVEEEIGCKGSGKADMSFFNDCRFVLQADRRNGGDLITSVGGKLCSEEFLDDINYKSFGYKPTSGLSTDVATLKSNGLDISCINISCGYYEPHADEEFTIISELENCLDFIQYIIENCIKVYNHEFEASYSYFGGSSSWKDWYGYGHSYSDWWCEDKDNASPKEDVEDEYIFYDEDFQAMEDIILNYNLTFEEIMSEWSSIFITTDKDYLRCMYDDIVEMYSCEN